MSTPKTADGVEVKAGDTVWAMIGHGRPYPGKVTEVAYGRYGFDGDCWIVVTNSHGQYPPEHFTSTRLACLTAARARAVEEVERLDAEIAKERGVTTVPPAQGT